MWVDPVMSNKPVTQAAVTDGLISGKELTLLLSIIMLTLSLPIIHICVMGWMIHICVIALKTQ